MQNFIEFLVVSDKLFVKMRKRNRDRRAELFPLETKVNF